MMRDLLDMRGNSIATRDLSPTRPTRLSPFKAKSVACSNQEMHKKRAALCANRTSGPDQKPSFEETGKMASKPNTRIPSEPQRYARAVPIGEVARKLLTDFAKQVRE